MFWRRPSIGPLPWWPLVWKFRSFLFEAKLRPHKASLRSEPTAGPENVQTAKPICVCERSRWPRWRCVSDSLMDELQHKRLTREKLQLRSFGSHSSSKHEWKIISKPEECGIQMKTRRDTCEVQIYRNLNAPSRIFWTVCVFRSLFFK